MTKVALYSSLALTACAFTSNPNTFHAPTTLTTNTHNTANIQSTALSATEEPSSPTGRTLLTTLSNAHHLMESNYFKNSLNAGKDVSGVSSVSGRPYHADHADHADELNEFDGLNELNEWNELDELDEFDVRHGIQNDMHANLLEEKAELSKFLEHASRLSHHSTLQKEENDMEVTEVTKVTKNMEDEFEYQDNQDNQDYEEEMLTQHAALRQLMESRFFKSSLNAGKDVEHVEDVNNNDADKPRHPYRPYHATYSDEDKLGDPIDEFDVRHGIQNDQHGNILEEKTELRKLMSHSPHHVVPDKESELTREEEFNASLELLVHRGALAEVLQSEAFRSTLPTNHPNEISYLLRSNMADAHLHTLLVGGDLEDDEGGMGGMPGTEYDFELAMLRGRGALNRLMEGSVHFEE